LSPTRLPLHDRNRGTSIRPCKRLPLVPDFRPVPRLSRVWRTTPELNSASRTVLAGQLAVSRTCAYCYAQAPLPCDDPPKLLVAVPRACESNRLFPKVFAHQCPILCATPRRGFRAGLFKPGSFLSEQFPSPLLPPFQKLLLSKRQLSMESSTARHRLAGRRFPADARRFRGGFPAREVPDEKAKRTWSFLVQTSLRAAAHACILMQPGDSVAPRNNPNRVAPKRFPIGADA
jgi:hypothetical protein